MSQTQETRLLMDLFQVIIHRQIREKHLCDNSCKLCPRTRKLSNPKWNMVL
ncbi:hypothetical protein FOFC_16240 [Fusarium oxysporum]|nr:hypothetical protein FOFC_16240 [Fusarium oxysporum]